MRYMYKCILLLRKVKKIIISFFELFPKPQRAGFGGRGGCPAAPPPVSTFFALWSADSRPPCAKLIIKNPPWVCAPTGLPFAPLPRPRLSSCRSREPTTFLWGQVANTSDDHSFQVGPSLGHHSLPGAAHWHPRGTGDVTYCCAAFTACLPLPENCHPTSRPVGETVWPIVWP